MADAGVVKLADQYLSLPLLVKKLKAIHQNILVLAYDNSNIDLILGDNSIYNIPDIYRKNIVGNKNINDITFVDQYAYLSSDLVGNFGELARELRRHDLFRRNAALMHFFEPPQLIGLQPKCLAFDLRNDLNSS